MSQGVLESILIICLFLPCASLNELLCLLVPKSAKSSSSIYLYTGFASYDD